MSGKAHRSRWLAFVTSLAVLFALAVPLLGVAQAQTSSACTLSIEPETDDNPVGTQHTVTATVTAGGSCDPTSSVIEVDFELVNSEGATYTFQAQGGTTTGSPDAGDTDESPDATCTEGTGGNAAGSCVITYTRSTAGTDEIEAWIDNDKNNTTVEEDEGEGQNETTSPGDETEPDDTDVATKTWSTAAPTNRALDCDDESGDDAQTNPHIGTGSTETYTCTLRNTNGTATTTDDVAVSGVKIDAENENSAVNDPGDDGTTAGTADYNDGCTTDATGKCTIAIASEGQQGTATICFWADFDGDTRFDLTGDAQDGGECDTEGSGNTTADENEAFGGTEAFNAVDATTDEVEKTWSQTTATAITVTPEADNNLVNTSHTVTINVTNQFSGGAQGANVDVRVTGRNTRVQNDLVTDASGNVTFTYTDTGSASTGGTDTITVCLDNTDNDTCPTLDSGEASDTATKNWVTSLPTVAAVTLDMQMDDDLPAALGGNDGDDCPDGAADANATATNTVGVYNGTGGTPTATGPGGAGDTRVHEICATATNSSGTAIVGQDFVFTITGPGNFTNEAGTNLGKSITVGSDLAGHAHAAVNSTEAGTTTVTVTTGGQSDSGTKTWRGTAARTLDCEPETQNATSGSSAVVTCTGKDAFGNATPLGNTADAAADTVTCTETGPGRITSATTPTLNANGQVEIVVETTTAETGTQTVTCELTVDTTDTDGAADTDDECDQAAGTGVGGTGTQTGAPAGACEDSVNVVWGGSTPTPDNFECNDGVDNDGDGNIDFPDDSDCQNPEDDSERDLGGRFNTSLTFRYDRNGDPPAFKGAVVSDRNECTQNRLVKIKRVKPGRDATVAKDRSNAKGNYVAVKEHIRRGKYYARTAQVTKTSDGGATLVCVGARSTTVKLRRN